MLDSQKLVGSGVRTRATRAVAAPVLLVKDNNATLDLIIHGS